MRWEQYINADEVRKTIAILKPNNQIFEIRIIGGTNKAPISGYFRDAETLLEKFDTIDVRNKNIYITLNGLNEGCFSRVQRESFQQTKVTTSDSDVEGYQWLFVDLDPIRPTGISSSNEEMNAAKELAGKIYNYLKGLGFEDPVKAISGNGCHLLYRISLVNNDENKRLVEDCLKTLAMIFDNDKVNVDTTNYNPARICKLHGTLAQKGTSTEDRPHRMSRIFSNSVDVKITQKVFLEKLVKQLPAQEPKRKQITYHSDKFDLIDFMSRHNITYKEDSNDRAKIYRLDHCPFDHNHTDGDSKIFQYSDGAIAFKCHHNSCRNYKWQDVRALFEPDAYDHTEFDDRIQKGYEAHNRLKKREEVPYVELNDKGEMFRTANMIRVDPEPVHEYIHSGIKTIDSKMHGLEKTCVTVISGLRGCGKSTLLGQIILSAINEDHTVVCYSGEMNNKKYLSWLMRQAAGKTNVEPSLKYDGGYGVAEEKQVKISEWMGERFWLYNNKYGNRFDEISSYLRTKLKDTRADLCIIDNLMALDLTRLNQDKYEAQTNFVWELKNLAELTNTHIIFVAHPRKASGFLRLTDISGSGNISNIVDNAFILHRWNRDFEKGFIDWFGSTPERSIPKCTNVIEVAKDRDGDSGLQDSFIPLYYEESTKRLLNDVAEYTSYGWDSLESSVFTEIHEEMETPF